MSEPAKGREAFRRWVESVDFDKLDYPSLRLIPGLFNRYGSDPLCEPYRGRMQGIYRYFMFHTNLVAADARRSVAALTEAGIESLLFKGIVLAVRYYGNLALRPMDDVDVLVRREDVPKAEAVLGDLGWRYRYDERQKKFDIHSHDYVNSRKSGFDLHWYTLYETPVDGIDEGVWARAELADWNGVPARWMGREDMALTSMVNGLRDLDTMRFEWILDVATIVSDRLGFDWKKLWEEAGRRQIRPMVFDAMTQFHRHAPDRLSADTLNSLLIMDVEFARQYLQRLIAENRTHAIDPAQRGHIKDLLGQEESIRPWYLRWFRPDAPYARDARDKSVPKYIRYTIGADGEIDTLYLHFRHLSLLKNFFDIKDPKLLARLIAQYKSGDEGLIKIPSGLLAFRKEIPLPGYRATIELADPTESIKLRPGEVSEIALYVCNHSRWCWFVRPDSRALYGVTYHLLTSEGMLIAWDQPRTYFIPSSPNYLAFIEPGQRISCRMKFIAPPTPGNYRLQLDMLQEFVIWFSSLKIRFPMIELEVVA